MTRYFIFFTLSLAAVACSSGGGGSGETSNESENKPLPETFLQINSSAEVSFTENEYFEYITTINQFGHTNPSFRLALNSDDNYVKIDPSTGDRAVVVN